MKQLIAVLLILITGCLPGFAQWTQTNGPEGARVYDLQRVNSNIWAGTDAGLFISSNEGQSWNLAGFLPPQSEVRKIFRRGEEIMLAVASVNLTVPSIVNAYHYYFYRSVDNGENWLSYDLPVGNVSIENFGERIKFFRIGTSIFFKNRYDFNEHRFDLFRSDNNGATWQRIITPNVSLIAGDAERLLIANSGSTYLSDTNGETWQLLDDIGTYRDLFVEGNRIFVDSQDEQLYISENLGQSWTIIQTPGGYGSSTRWVRGNSGKLYHLNRAVYVSEDNGYTWDTLNNLVPNTSFLTDVVELSNGELLVGMEDGIFRLTDNGMTWPAANNNLVGSTIYGSIALPNGDIIAPTNLGYFRSTDGGDSWNSIRRPSQSSDLINSIAIKDDSLFIHGYNRQILLSTDHLNTLDTIGEIPYQLYNIRFKYVKGRFYVLGTESYQSDDLVNWNPLVVSDPESSFFRINDLSDAGNGTLLTTLSTGQIFRSEDNGATWQLNFEFTPPGVRRFEFFEIDNRIFYYDWNGWYFTTDQGMTWNSPAMDGLPETTSGRLPIIITNDGQNIYARIFGYGVYRSTDFGENWVAYNTGLETFRHYGIFYSNDYLYLESLASGVWRRAVDVDIVAIPEVEEINSNLLQIFPNPASEYTSLTLKNREAGNGVLELFDVQGRLIRQQNIRVETGSVPINLLGINPGFYKLVLSLNDKRYTGSLLVQ